MKLTRELIEAIEKCDRMCDGCSAIYLCDQNRFIVAKRLATALLAEMDKPKVWDGAPDDCTHCQVNFIRHMRAIYSVVYERELPKSRERQIADEVYGLLHTDVNKSSIDIPIIEQALLKYKAELEAGR